MTNQPTKLIVPQHFYKPPNSTKWYVRLVPPERLWPLWGKKEFRKSTGHECLERAKPIGMKFISDKFNEWASIELTEPDTPASPTILSRGLIETICDTRRYSWSRSDDDDRESEEGLSEEEVQGFNDFSKLTVAAMRSVLIQGKGSPRWDEVVNMTLDWCDTMDLKINIEDPLLTDLVRKFAKTEQQAQKDIELRNRGEGTETSPPPDTLRSLSEINDIFVAQKSIKSVSKHVNTMLHAWKLFTTHCGDIAFDKVTQKDIFDFLEERMHDKVKPWSEARAKNFGIRTLHEFFALARAQNFMTIANPAGELKVFPSLSKEDEKSRKNPRYPFSAAQLNMFLTSAWYDPTNIRQFTGKMQKDTGARYWVPLIGICHGNRVGEGMQFVVSDFSFIDELFVMSFRTELDKSLEDTKNTLEDRKLTSQDLTNEELKKLRHLKNISTRRVVPVHPNLIKLGFVNFVAQRRLEAGANGLLFPSSQPTKHRLQRAKTWTRLRAIVS
jgi:hypothetical protein